jgi:hypothetical protein
VQGFLDYVTTVGNTVIFFTQEGGKQGEQGELGDRFNSTYISGD